MADTRWSAQDYLIDEHAVPFLTPALAIYKDAVQQNIAAMLAAVGGDAGRWRPHVKTAKIGAVMRMLSDAGVTACKCATTLELLTACRNGATDVVVAYAHGTENAQRVAQIARQFPDVHTSALVESSSQVANWAGSGVDLFIDLNPGMDRTGVNEADWSSVAGLIHEIHAAGIGFRGLHYYDGHIVNTDYTERTAIAFRGYDHLMGLVQSLAEQGVDVGEVITAGTQTFPCALEYPPFSGAAFRHSVSPGTVIYGDVMTFEKLPPGIPLRPAAFVLSRIISHPRDNVVTCDAGHKAVSVDSGVPNCLVLNFSDLEPMKPSEEHLPLRVPEGSAVPPIGTLLYLEPKHVCPTVNNFDDALLVSKGKIETVAKVDARGRENPLAATAATA